MKVVFRDIIGKCFENEFPENATVADACNFLASKLQISDQQIFIISPEEGKNFYESNIPIEKIINENPDFVVFSIYFNIDKNEQYKPFIDSQSSINNNSDIKQVKNVIGHSMIINKHNMTLPSKEIINTLLMLKKYKMMNPIYLEYSHITTHVPADLQGRVKHIAQLGYQIEDCLSALRTHHYNVQQAIHSLMTINGPTNQNNHNNVKAARQQSTPLFR